MRVPVSTALLASAAFALAGAPAALADSTASANWAGYAVHRSGISFTRVLGSWRQPRATCTAGQQSYSAVWVGLGGYDETSNALEQIGTEVDCGMAGSIQSSAWYELVPAPSRTIGFTVRPGDLIAASVSVARHHVLLTLADNTTHRAFVKTLHASALDVSSAEWIVEAPSGCVGQFSCQTLPLADFGSATFRSAKTRSTRGHRGTISDRTWGLTKITLTPGGQPFVTAPRSGPAAGAAAPSALSDRGTSFTVFYRRFATQATSSLTRPRAFPRSRRLVYPGRRAGK